MRQWLVAAFAAAALHGCAVNVERAPAPPPPLDVNQAKNEMATLNELAGVARSYDANSFSASACTEPFEGRDLRGNATEEGLTYNYRVEARRNCGTDFRTGEEGFGKNPYGPPTRVLRQQRTIIMEDAPPIIIRERTGRLYNYYDPRPLRRRY